jgi:signal transduction histidine kinase
MTSSPRLSLRARLLAGLIAVTALFLVIMGTVTAFVVSGHLQAQFNDSLLATLGETPTQLENSPANALAFVGLRGTVYSFSNGSPDSGALTAGLNQLPVLQLRAHVRAHTVFQVPGDGGLSAAGRRVSAAGLTGYMVIAEPNRRVADGVRSLVLAELITGCALLALLALGGRWLIGRGLGPLNQMATTAQRITAQGDLTARMPDPGDHAEVGGLADAINTMLDRIQQAFSARLQSEQKVRQFAADASHELRIDEESQRMSRLVAELLELARLDRSSSLTLTETDLALLVRDAAADAGAVEPDRPISVQAPDRLVVVADEPRIRQILANLLANVRAHTPPATPVELRLSAAPGGALIEVADSGPGMTPDDAARAFDRFHRSTRDAGGSGLGLSIVQAIAAAHNGHADLTSAPGRGTLVRIWLPEGPVT